MIAGEMGLSKKGVYLEVVKAEDRSKEPILP